MTNTKNLNIMSGEIFTADRLVLLRDAVVEVFDIFQSLLEKPVYQYSDIKSRLDTVGETKWQVIRARLFDSDYTGVTHDEFTKDEKNTVVYVILKFIRAVDKCTATVTKNLEKKNSQTTDLENKIRELEGKLRTTDELLQSTKMCYSQKCSENMGLHAQITHLQDIVNEKNRKLLELEKNSNVVLWEKERKRILKDSIDKIAELETELEEMKSGRENYRRRMSNIDESHKRMMMKQQILNQRSPAPSDSGDSDDLSRKNFILDKVNRCSLEPSDRGDSNNLSSRSIILDKDVSFLEKELYDLQTNTVGVIGGIKTDFYKLAHKFKGETGIDKDFEQLSTRMDKVYHAVSEGRMDNLTESLPPHYRYIENKNFRVKRIRRLSQTAVVPPQSTVANIYSNSHNANYDLHVSAICSIDFLVVVCSRQVTIDKILNQMIEEKIHGKPGLNGITEDQKNPVIMISKTKKLHPINPIKYFPHISQQFIIDQYERFTEFDSNNDESLDLTEMVKVVTQLGFNFNAHQLQEAMEEVDKDHNHTLDFYEYLLVIDNIYKRRGKAELFQQGLNEMNRRNMSKACAIQ